MFRIWYLLSLVVCVIYFVCIYYLHDIVIILLFCNIWSLFCHYLVIIWFCLSSGHSIAIMQLVAKSFYVCVILSLFDCSLFGNDFVIILSLSDYVHYLAIICWLFHHYSILCIILSLFDYCRYFVIILTLCFFITWLLFGYHFVIVLFFAS